MTARKIEKSWWVDFRVDYIRYRKRSPENSRAGAEAYEATLRHRLAQGQPIDGPQRVAAKTQSFETFAAKWFEEYVVPNNKLSEQRSKQIILRASLIPFFGRRPIGAITARDIERYKARTARTGVKNKTINNRLTVLRKCLATAYDWLELDGAPPEIEWLKCAPPKIDYLSKDECAQLLAHSSGIVRELIQTALLTGMRQGELKGLQWSSIDWQTRVITVRHAKNDWSDVLDTPKSNRVRYIPMNQALYHTLAGRRSEEGYVFLDSDGKPFDKKRLMRRLNRVCRRAQMRPIGWHILRHTFASHLAMKGAPLGAVQALLGHSSINTTMRYAHMAPSALRSAIELLTVANDNHGQPAGNLVSRGQIAA
jgi:integrase